MIQTFILLSRVNSPRNFAATDIDRCFLMLAVAFLEASLFARPIVVSTTFPVFIFLFSALSCIAVESDTVLSILIISFSGIISGKLSA